MAINEVFPNPTVKQVIFQVRFPNLFYIESRMGEFQLKVMKDFPKSSMALTRQILIAQGVQIPEAAPAQSNAQPSEVGKVWNFESERLSRLHRSSPSTQSGSIIPISQPTSPISIER